MIVVDKNSRSPRYLINESAISFTENYQGVNQKGNPIYDVVAVSIASNAAIMVFDENNGISYGDDLQYQRWRLNGATTGLVSAAAHNIYARLSRGDKKEADIIFSVRNYNTDGNFMQEGEMTEHSDTYYYILIGTLTALSDANAAPARTLTFDPGYLGLQKSNNEQGGGWISKMFELVVDAEELIRAKLRFENIRVKGEALFDSIASFYNGFKIGAADTAKEITSVATDISTGEDEQKAIATPAYVKAFSEGRYLSKTSTDPQSVAGPVTFEQDVTVQGNQAIAGNQTIQGTQEVKGRTQFRDKVEFGKNGFAEGLTGYGGQVDEHGRAKFRSLELYESLTVPEINYNRITILAGTQWRSAGGGIIESVVVDVDGNSNALASGVVTLKLEEGEIGKVDVDDLCMGIFHNIADTSQNETEDVDDGRGNFRFSGFFTSYFRITEILESGNNSKFRYVLRESDGFWSKRIHPCAEMNFVGYGNLTKPERQNSRYSALTYERYLRGVNTWNFQADNIVAQFGDLSNLGVLGLVMDGYSAYLDNVYMRGTIQEVTALPLRMEIGIDGYQTMAFGETIHVECRVYRGWEDITDSVKKWSVVRGTADTSSDEAWLMKDKVRNFSGMIEIAWTESENDLGNMTTAGVSALFTFTASTIDDETIETSLEI